MKTYINPYVQYEPKQEPKFDYDYYRQYPGVRKVTRIKIKHHKQLTLFKESLR